MSVWASARLRACVAAVALVIALLACPASAQDTQPTGRSTASAHTVEYDRYSFSIDGRRVYLWSGEFHYWRLPSPSLWRDVLQKFKAAGYNAVSIYFHWGFHSPKRGVYDFTGIRDVDRLLDIAEQEGIYVIARPGPYINAETDGGGLPAWLTTSPARDRSDEPDYLAAVDEWLDHINPIIARHQLTNGTGTVILYQNENEFGDHSASGVAYMTHLQERAKAEGITVPTFHNTAGIWENWVPGTPGAPDLYAFDLYPQGFNCSDPATWSPVPDVGAARQYSANGPLFTAEFQGGAFDWWWGNGYDKCRQLTGPDFERVFYQNNISYGVTAQNFYMGYGGTSWGWLPAPSQVYSSYDYGAAISEARQLTAKYAVQKEMGYFLQAVAPITKTDRAPDVPASDPDVLVRRLRNPDTLTDFFVARHSDSRSTATDTFTFPLDGVDGAYPSVPQSGSITLAGRDSKLLVAGYDLGGQRLVYSTSELMTHLRSGNRDLAVLHGRDGQDGETVLRYASQPKVTVLSGAVSSSWDEARGDLRLNYAHDGLAEVLVRGGGRPDLLLLIGSDSAVERLWQLDTRAGPVLALGPALLRTAESRQGSLRLTGDTDQPTPLRVWAPASTRSIDWNGHRLATDRDTTGAFTADLAGPRPVALPVLTDWRRSPADPTSAAGFEDATWPIANKTATTNPNQPAEGQPVLGADEYGFHHGDVWYRGHFTAAGTETAVNLTGITGNAGLWSAWLNGVYLGSSNNGGGGRTLTLPAGALRPGQDNVLAVVVRNMGHNQTYGNNAFKEPRGVTGSFFIGSEAPVTWRLHGNTGGQTGLDPVRGPFNNGGLYGENAGWSLPGFPDTNWTPTTLPATEQQPGVQWYRTTVNLNLPAGQDTSIGLRITDDPAPRPYRAQIFVNGWNIGQYVSEVGPQHLFAVPNGILRARGPNTIAIANWSTAETGGLGAVTLENLGTVRGGVPVTNLHAPRYDARTYAPPVVHGRARVTAPASADEGETFTVRASYRPVTTARNARLTLVPSTGWSVTSPATVDLGTVPAGATAEAVWQVAAPSAGTPRLGVFTATATARQRGRPTTASGAASTVIPIPPPTGTAYVSDLPFSASNGWGPVERDQSNGEAGAGDGRPITIEGVTYAKGLGVHPPGDVRIFLGGNCARFTAVAGVDDETGQSGSVRFSVLADGETVTSTAVLRGTDPGVPVSADLTGAQWLDLVVDDGGDGNGLDHADWADAILTCMP